MRTELCEIMTKHGSDKGNGWHNYTEYYFELFKDLRNENLNIFELGLGTNNLDVKSNMGINGKPGASHRGWKEFFKNSNIYGADIDKRVLFEEERIKTFYCDQTDKETIKYLFETDLKSVKFDIIIEDGLHEFSANETFLRNSIDFLKEGGIYIIEDLLPETVNQFNIIKQQLISDLNIKHFEIIELEFEKNPFDNKLLVIKK
jgi:SAM-dependent methyltransferase